MPMLVAEHHPPLRRCTPSSGNCTVPAALHQPFLTHSVASVGAPAVLLPQLKAHVSKHQALITTGMSDWGLDWELPEYPQLPKLFTNAKTAKKRKHKEFIITDELLEQPVKLSKLSGTAGKTVKASHQQAAPAAAAAAADAAPAEKPGKKDAKKQKQQQQPKDPIDAVYGSEQAAGYKQKKQKNQPQQQPDHAGTQAPRPQYSEQQQQQQLLLQQQPRMDQATGQQQQPAHKNKSKKQKHMTDTTPLLNGSMQADAGPIAGGITAVAAAGVAGEPEVPKQKKSKNKFKQPEFLAQQQQQQELQQAKPSEKPQKQQQQLHPQQRQQQAKHKVADAGHRNPEANEAAAADGTKPHKPKKQKKEKQQQQQQRSPATQQMASPAVPAAAAAKPTAAASGGGSKLLQQFKERLAGSRFRQLNEALYTQPGNDSFTQMQEQPELFAQYHEGFQQQVKSWPTQPLDVAISWLKDKPSEYVVVDYGCGEARLAATVKQTVQSLDLVAAAPGVIACNMAHSPLAAGSCDAAVFSLALMGTDYGEFLLDAARVLKKGGWLWIAEVRSRFAGGSGSDDFRPLLSCLQQLGFKLVKQDAKNKMFVVFVLKKQQQVDAAAASSIRWPTLKACVYKKR